MSIEPKRTENRTATDQEWQPVSGRTLFLIALGIAFAGFVIFVWMKSTTLRIRANDWQARYYLKSLFPHLRAYRGAHGRWPTKEELIASKPQGLADDRGKPFPEDDIELLWRDCTIIQPTAAESTLAYVPSEEIHDGERVFVVLKANGDVGRLTHTEQTDLPR